jgi:hypothetical protein
MISRFLTVLLLVPAIALASGAQMSSRAFYDGEVAPMAFRAAHISPVAAVSLAAPAKAVAIGDVDGRRRVGDVRTLSKASPVTEWIAVDGGYVARLVARSEQAAGLRVKLALGVVPGVIEARVQGAGERIESMPIDPLLGPEAWTPWTEGDSQVIELFSTVRPSPGAVRIESVVHFADSPLAKAASSCTLQVACSSGDSALDVALAERKKSVARMVFNDAGGAFLCTTTLLNTEKFPAAYILTANHCINNAASAASLSTFWFYESSTCGSDVVNPGFVQVGGGAAIVFANHDADSTLLLMNRNPPTGVVYSGWNPAPLQTGDAIVSVSHPKGDTTRYALGNISREYRIVGYPYDMYGVQFTRGIIEGGSSGSGLFTMSGGTLQLRGVLSGSTVMQPGGLSCTNLTDQGLYARFEVFEPQIDQYIRLATQAPDDAPNRPQDLFNAPFSDPTGVDMPLDQRSGALTFANRRIDYAGDQDVYRFRLTVPASVTVGTTGSVDTVGQILDSNGVELESNDDGTSGNTNFSITRQLPAGTFYVQVAHWEPAGTGTYSLTMSAATTGDNYTDLWWNANESGWGVNLNHQGSTLFATLFTYDLDGTAMWLVMSNGTRQSDGSWSGPLYRTTGTPFNAQTFAPIGPANYTTVGTMRFLFANGGQSGTLVYTVNGNTVSKAITRNTFATHPTCAFTTTDRTTATNYQDLWYNQNESGWGVNVTHQGDTLFATLFIYDSNSQGTWLVMSNGVKTGTGIYSGTLYRTTGPPYNSSPFTPIGPGNYTTVGTMTLTFGTGNLGTLVYTFNGSAVTKLIQRLIIASPTTLCTP